MKSHFCRIVALFLSFALFIGIPQFSVVATLIERDQTVTQTNNAATDNAVSAEDEKTAVIVGEDESLRTENVRKFRLSDGSYIAAMYDDAVNYNDNGVWKEIDNTLCLKDGYYTNKANNFKVSLPAGLSDNTGISIGYGEYKLSFSPLNIKYTDVKVTQPEESKLDLLKKRASELAIQTEKGVSTNRSEISGLDDAVLSMDEKELKKAINNAYMSANKTESSVKYASVHSGVDIGYSLQSDKLKESIVLNSAGAEKDFRFLINANGFNAELAKDGSVLFKDGEKTIFTIASPYMWDANGEYSRDIKVSLDKTDGGYTYTLVPSEDWLRDPGRAYPVTVDPTFQYGDFYSVTDKTCTFVNPLTTSDRNKLVNETFLLRVGKFYGGTEAGSLIYADVLNGLNLGDARIVNAQMVLKFYGYYNAANLHLNAYRVTTPVSTWGNLSDPIFPSTLSISYDSSQIFDYIVTPADTSGLHNATCVFDITNLAWQWQNGTANNGVLLRATNFPSYGDRLVTFYDSSCGGASTDPKFVITYRNTEGLENYWTYHSQDVGRAGTGYINDYKGNLIFIHNDVTTTGNKMPISINHVYNSTNNDMNIGLGCGWSLSSYEYVKCVNDIPGYPMKYVDADGTTHYFADIGNNKSEDEDGLGLTLEYFPNNPTERTYIITDKNNNKKEFSANGPLMKVIDSNGNYYTQSYQTINGLCRLVSVTDGAGRVTTLNYNGNAKLVSIVDPSNRTTQYTYDTTGNYLVSITYPDNEVTHYEYNGPGGRLSRAINCDQYRIDYNYSTIAPYRMYWIDEANGSNVGFILYMSYGYNETYFDENNRRTTYQFNNFGQTVCIEDNEGKAQYYKMGAPGGSGGAANKVTFASKLQKTTSNLLKNHSFEFANSGEWIESTWNLNNGSRSFNGEGYIGSHSARCISYDTDACFSGYRQCYNAQPNTKYTFSAYVKLKSYTDYFGWHYGALVQINTDSGCVESEKITTVSDDWVRISATCTTGATVSYFYVEFGIEHAYGEALFDCMQLEAGETVNRYNLLENSALEGSVKNFV